MILGQVTAMGNMLMMPYCNLEKPVVVRQLKMADILICNWFVVEQLRWKQQQLAVVVVEKLVVVYTFQTVVEVEEVAVAVEVVVIDGLKS